MTTLNIGVGLVKTALKIACASFDPQTIAEESFNLLIDESADYYGSKHNALKEQINRVISEKISDKNLNKLHIPAEKRKYIVSETVKLLDEVTVSVADITDGKNDNQKLANGLLKQYEKGCSEYPLDEKEYISLLLQSILPQLIECLQKDTSFLFSGLLSLQATVDELREEIKKLKLLNSAGNQSEYPSFLTDRPYDITDGFIGREAYIQTAVEQLLNENSLTLSGVGGIGKTEIAKAIVRNIEKMPCKEHGITKIAWINYDNQNVFFSIAKSLRETKGIEDLNIAWDKAYTLIQKLRNSLLLVIDNVETLEDDNLLRIADLPCRLLLTSRVEKISSIQTKTVESLPIEECLRLFLTYYKQTPAPRYYLEKIIKLADCHTVTIELLGKIAQIEEMPLQEFYQKLVDSGFKMSSEKAAAGHERLHKEEIIIKQLARLFSVQKLDAEETSLLVPVSVIPSLPFSFQQAKEWFGQQDRSILNKLSESGWIRKVQKDGHSCYSIHSVIASAVRYQFIDSLYSQCREFIRALTIQLRYDEDEHGSAKADLIQFSWSVNDLLESNLQEETDADFLYYFSRIYEDIGNYDQALRLLRHSVRIYRRQDETKLLKLAHTYNSIGLIYNDKFEYKRALTQYKKAAQILNQIDSTQVDWIPVCTNIGMTFMALEGTKSDGYANAYLSDALEMAKDQYGENDPKTLNIKFKLGNCLAGQNPQEAKKIFQNVIDAEEAHYGADHWIVAEKCYEYGNFLYDIGELHQAEIMLERALNIFTIEFGKDHPSTAEVKNTLGLINLNTEPVKARKYFKDYLDNVTDTYGEISQATAAAWNNLGLSVFNSEDYKTALSYFERAERIINKVDDRSADEIGMYHGNQAQCYNELGDYEKAIDYYNQTLDEYRKDAKLCAGAEAKLYGQIADVYENMHKLTDAEDYYQLAEKKIKEQWGETHVSLASVYHNYGMFLAKERRYDEALVKLEDSKQILEDAYEGTSISLGIVEEHILNVRKAMDDAG